MGRHLRSGCLMVSPSPGVLCQVLVQMLGPGLLKTLSLTCSVSGFSITNSADCWDWIPQPPGKGLGWLGCFGSGNSTAYDLSLQI